VTRGNNVAEDVDRDVTSIIDDVRINRFVLDLKNALGLVGFGGEFLEEVGIGVAELRSASRIWGIMLASQGSNGLAQQSSNATKTISKDSVRVNRERHTLRIRSLSSISYVALMTHPKERSRRAPNVMSSLIAVTPADI
jgi:hypothetical protein